MGIDERSINGQLGLTGITAQVQPVVLTAGMMRAAEVLGTEFRLGSITGLLRRGEIVVGVDREGEMIEGNAVVIAMGAMVNASGAMLPFRPCSG